MYFERTVMIIVVQCLCDGPCQRLAWDPGITGLGISLTDGDEWIFIGGIHFDFPVSFSIGGSMSLVGDSLPHYGSNMFSWWRSCWGWYGLGGQTHFGLRPCVICRRLMVLICYRTILHRALQFTS
jgi:hypothetical protein